MRTHIASDKCRRRSAGFTLVELLAVLAMISILAVLAIAGYRRYLSSSKSSEAKATMSAIRIAEENFRAETLGYLSCSATLTSWYPAAPNGKKRHWVDNGNVDIACWRMLNVVTDVYTRYGFAVMAGPPGTPMPVPNTAQVPVWPVPTTEPWYVIQASGDNDNDGVRSLFVTSSINGEVYAENDEE